MIVKKNKILIVILLLLTVSSCKETCYTCRTTCVSFNDYSNFYCLDGFVDENHYIHFTDSMATIYGVEEIFINPNSFCEDDIDKLHFLTDFGWECSEYIN